MPSLPRLSSCRVPAARRPVARALAPLLIIAFAMFVSVANATAEEAGITPAGAAPAEAVIAVIPEVAAAAPTEAPAVTPTAPAQQEPAPITETPAAPVAVVEPAPAAAAAPATADAPAIGEATPVPVASTTPTKTPEVAPVHAQVLAAPARIVALKPSGCQGASTCRIVALASGGWAITADAVKVCHATSGIASTGYGFNLITPNSDSIDLPGSAGNSHGGHATNNFWTVNPSIDVGDIVEPFLYWIDDTNGNDLIDADEVGSYAGSNLGSIAAPSASTWASIYGIAGLTGQQILDAGCTAATPAPAVCPAGTTGVFPACMPIVAPTCPAGTAGVFPACMPIVAPTCPVGTTGVFPICLAIAPLVCAPPSVLTDGICVIPFVPCVEPSALVDGVCTPPDTCAAGQTGTPPNCVTPVVLTCPAGTTGTPPDCLTTAAAACPIGQVGTPPNCTTPAAVPVIPVTPVTPVTPDTTPVTAAATPETTPVAAGGPAATPVNDDVETAALPDDEDATTDETPAAELTTSATPDTTDNSGDIPFTGSELRGLGVLGLLLLSFGVALLRGRRQEPLTDA